MILYVCMYVCNGDTGVLHFALRPQFLWVTLDVFISQKRFACLTPVQTYGLDHIALSVEQVAVLGRGGVRRQD